MSKLETKQLSIETPSQYHHITLHKSKSIFEQANMNLKQANCISSLRQDFLTRLLNTINFTLTPTCSTHSSGIYHLVCYTPLLILDSSSYYKSHSSFVGEQFVCQLRS